MNPADAEGGAGPTAGDVGLAVPEDPAREPLVRRMSRTVLTLAVRGRTGGVPGREAHRPVWGTAILAEFEETTGGWEAIRWTASGVRISLRERRRGRPLPGAIGDALWHSGMRRRLLVLTLAAALLIAFGNQYVVTARHVPGGSMETTLMINDRILVDRVAFRIVGLERGDVVIVERRIADASTTIPFQVPIRLIGLAGDRISCRDGAVWRNGAAVDEPYLEPGTVTECEPVTVPPGEVYLLGDHRAAANDSRFWGPVDEAGIVGRVTVRVWPAYRLSPVR